MVPFRLTQNLVDGFGASGVEGVYRKSCEVTLQVGSEGSHYLDAQHGRTAEIVHIVPVRGFQLWAL